VESEDVWIPPQKIEELYAKEKISQINSFDAGARTETALPSGNAPIQLYSLATLNGQKIGILLEELGIDYDAHVINIGKGDQFSSGYIEVNPNSKIPALVDKEGPDGKPIHLFESASMMLYLAEKYNRFIPKDPRLRVEMFNWLFWQMAGQGPMTGNFGHFLVYAPAHKKETREYGVQRYGMDTQRLCDVLDRHLAGREFIVGNEYTIADMICFPWFNFLLNSGYKNKYVAAGDFLGMSKYKNGIAWAERIRNRPAVQRGITVCSFNGGAKPWLNTESK